MIKKIILLLLCILMMFFLFNCSSTQQNEESSMYQGGDTQTNNDSFNSENYEESNRIDESEPEQYSGADGEIEINVKVGNTPSQATIKIEKGSGSTPDIIIENGNANTGYKVAPGRYNIFVKLDSTFDRPQQIVKGVSVLGGEKVTKEVQFNVGTIVLIPLKNKRAVKGTIRWRYAGGGDWFPEQTNIGDEVTLSTGRYDAEVSVGGKMAVIIPNIQVYEGKRTINSEITVH